jgi:hypothetical protein
MSSVVSALVSHYEAIINDEMPTRFTAHQFIQRLTQQHQALYIEALYHYKDSAQPFQVVHGMLSNHLHDFEALVKRIGEVPSIAIFGTPSTVAQWEKL